MTVKELISQSQQFPDDAVVCYTERSSITSSIEGVKLFHEIGSAPIVFLSERPSVKIEG